MSKPRVALVYFSQTGNTEKVARAVADGLTESGAEVEVLDILKTDPASMSAFDMIGIGTPVFYYRDPVIVERFVKQIPLAHDGHAFVFLTSGGHPCNTFFHMKKELSRRGFLTIDTYKCHGYDTYPAYKGVDRFLGHPDEKELSSARAFGAQLLERSGRIRQGETKLVPTFKRHWDRFGRLSIIFRNKRLSKLILPRKIIDTEKCTKCGLCAKHCPVDVIEMDDYPVFKSGCVHCYMCERVCPEEAIECDWTFIKKKMNVSSGENG